MSPLNRGPPSIQRRRIRPSVLSLSVPFFLSLPLHLRLLSAPSLSLRGSQSARRLFSPHPRFTPFSEAGAQSPRGPSTNRLSQVSLFHHLSSRVRRDAQSGGRRSAERTVPDPGRFSRALVCARDFPLARSTKYARSETLGILRISILFPPFSFFLSLSLSFCPCPTLSSVQSPLGTVRISFWFFCSFVAFLFFRCSILRR